MNLKVYKNCQSCGMPLSKDPNGGGTNSDRSKSTMYCSFCYQYGYFSRPNMTAQEMQELVKSKLIEMKLPKFLANWFCKGIPNLERWKNKQN